MSSLVVILMTALRGPKLHDSMTVLPWSAQVINLFGWPKLCGSLLLLLQTQRHAWGNCRLSGWQQVTHLHTVNNVFHEADAASGMTANVHCDAAHIA